jgi:hypothetical protein
MAESTMLRGKKTVRMPSIGKKNADIVSVRMTAPNPAALSTVNPKRAARAKRANFP